jgi:hypothetical protein
MSKQAIVEEKPIAKSLTGLQGTEMKLHTNQKSEHRKDSLQQMDYLSGGPEPA